jgi:hypothetical protein
MLAEVTFGQAPLSEKGIGLGDLEVLGLNSLRRQLLTIVSKYLRAVLG